MISIEINIIYRSLYYSTTQNALHKIVSYRTQKEARNVASGKEKTVDRIKKGSYILPDQDF